MIHKVIENGREHGRERCLIFKPRPSKGWVWLLCLAMLLFSIGTVLPLPDHSPWWMVTLSIGLSALLGLVFLAFAAWFPTMRYELDDTALTLIYGPVLRYRIPLAQIRGTQCRNLNVAFWSSVHFPGLVLFTVPYSDVGEMKMCATAVNDNILVIGTDDALYGITPADESAFVTALQTRINDTATLI
jgi:hypothetical protein